MFTEGAIRRTNLAAYVNWESKHVCKYNHKGAVGKMNVVGVKRIWERSAAKNKICYTEFYDDGGSNV